MKKIKGGCTASVTCPSGRTLSCTDPTVDGHCHSEGDGTIEGYVNCGVGAAQLACWWHEPY